MLMLLSTIIMMGAFALAAGVIVASVLSDGGRILEILGGRELRAVPAPVALRRAAERRQRGCPHPRAPLRAAA